MLMYPHEWQFVTDMPIFSSIKDIVDFYSLDTIIDTIYGGHLPERVVQAFEPLRDKYAPKEYNYKLLRDLLVFSQITPEIKLFMQSYWASEEMNTLYKQIQQVKHEIWVLKSTLITVFDEVEFNEYRNLQDIHKLIEEVCKIFFHKTESLWSTTIDMGFFVRQAFDNIKKDFRNPEVLTCFWRMGI